MLPTNLTPLTLFRVHPVESVFYFARGLIVFGLVSGIFVWLFGSKVNGLHVLGVDLFGFIFAAMASNLRHSPIWLSFGKLENFLISPAQHQLHHSKAPRHYGANYGSCLAIWDWLGGSLHLAKGQKGLRFGVADTELNHDPHALGSTLLGPFRGCWRLIAGWVRARLPASRVECD